MWLAIVPAIIAAVATVAMGITSYVSQKKTNEVNKAQYEDWKSYNSPENQMNRLQDAGLNKYLVSNVSNTLSQPYQVGTNTGVSELLGSLAGVAQQGGNSYMQQQYNKDVLSLQKDKIDNQREQLRLNSIGMQIKEMLAKNAVKIGDFRAALLATQGKIANNQYDFLQRTLPYRVGNTFYDYLLNQQNYTFGEQMNPLKLKFYSPMQRAIINHYAAQDAHLRWYEDFALQKSLRDYDIGLKNYYLRLNKHFDDHSYNYDRLHLSNQYFDLAEKKWFWSMFNDVIKNSISLKKPY